MSKVTPHYVTSDKCKDLIPRLLADLNEICAAQHELYTNWGLRRFGTLCCDCTKHSAHKLRAQTFRNTLCDCTAQAAHKLRAQTFRNTLLWLHKTFCTQIEGSDVSEHSVVTAQHKLHTNWGLRRFGTLCCDCTTQAVHKLRAQTFRNTLLWLYSTSCTQIEGSDVSEHSVVTAQHKLYTNWGLRRFVTVCCDCTTQAVHKLRDQTFRNTMLWLHSTSCIQIEGSNVSEHSVVTVQHKLYTNWGLRCFGTLYCDCTTQAVHKLRAQTFRNTLLSPDGLLPDLHDKFQVDLLVSNRQHGCAMPVEQCGHAATVVLLSGATGTEGFILLQ